MKSRARTPVIVFALALAALALIPAAASAKRQKLPVPWTVTDALALQGSKPNSAPPGSNNFNCKPTKAHPRPVILVHGLLANRTVNFATTSPLLYDHGYCVFTKTYGTKDNVKFPGYQPGGLEKMQKSAHQLKDFINKVRRRTGSNKVDIVGHSEGSLMPNYYVKFLGGDKVVHNYVGVTPLWAGTNTLQLATLNQIGGFLGLSPALTATLKPVCESCRQFLVGSDFIHKMQDGGVASDRVHYTTIATKNDELVMPYTSGHLTGKHVKNYVIQNQCPGPAGLGSPDQSEHLSLIFDPNAAQDILNALDPGRNKPLPCAPVLPGVGAVGYSGDLSG